MTPFYKRPPLKSLALLCLPVLMATSPILAHAEEKSAPASNLAAENSGMDNSVMPGDDFNRYANGGWLKSAVMPDDKAYIGVFDILAEEASAKVKKILERATTATPGSAERQVGDYYSAYLNIHAINKLGLAPLQPKLNAINKISNKNELASYFGAQLRADVDPVNDTHFDTENLFGLWVAQEFHDHTKYAGYLLQGGLGLPDREFYMAKSPSMEKIRSAYKAYIANLFKLAQVADPDRAAQRVFDLERRIADGHATREDSENMQKADNKWSKADFATKAPGLNWRAYFVAAGLDAQPALMVWHPSAFTSTSNLVKNVSLTDWKDYLRFHAINQSVAVLPQPFFDERFKLSATINGLKTPEPRWKYAERSTNSALGEEVGRLYIADNFSPQAKEKIKNMVGNLMAAFDVQINNNSWMAPSTKQEALKKIKAFYVGVGYPDKWRDYSGLKIDANDAFGNRERASQFSYQYALSKFGKPVDVAEWCMNPQTVNAVNMPLQNAINFPAAILQKPFFDVNASDAANYGAIGAIIGHEISHSFDHSGSMIDAKGELRNWWTAEDLAHFEQSTTALADQFSKYKPFPDLAVNGVQTLDENIADLTGLTASLNAYHSALIQRGVALTKERDQEFFVAFGTAWRSKMREEAMRSAMVSDGHALPEFRVLTVRNLDAWYAAFNVQPGQQLYLAPDNRVKIW